MQWPYGAVPHEPDYGGGWIPWTVIPVGERNAYMNALKKASVGEGIALFADFLAKLVEKRLAGAPLPEVPTDAKAITHE